MSELRYETFTVSTDPGTVDPRGAEFVAAIDHGFLERPRSEDLVISQLDRFRADGTLLSVVYDDAQDPRSVGAHRPVATFGDFSGSICVRDGVVVPASMITEVTVRGTHRRRGILSRLMRTALHRAADNGFALAALTASEGGIYGRFGFGAAAYGTAITVRSHHGLRLRPAVREAIEAAGLQVIVPTWDAYAAAYAEVYPRFQRRTVGQIGATEAFRRRAGGAVNGWALPGVDLHVRPSLVIDATGEVQGFALATPKEGRRLEIVDLGAATPLAQLALWESLAATDLVDELTWRESAIDTPLRWALSDGRDLGTGRSGDRLWLRLLDLRAAYAARGLAASGSVVFDVADDEGLIGGIWTVRTTDAGTNEVTQGEDGDAPRLQIDPETLASLYLGAADVRTLVGLGRATAAPEHLSELARLLAPGTTPRNTYPF